MQTETLKIGGMTCGGCVAAVTKALQAVDGVADVDVSLEQGAARIAFDETRTSRDQLRTVVARAGYDVASAGTAPRKGGCCCG